MNCAIAQVSRIGRRPSNQDRIGHWRTAQTLLLVVADGMGGHAHGEFAAELALCYAAAMFRSEASPRLMQPARFLRAAALGAHAALLQEADALGLADTPRTTFVACVVQEGRAHWAHVGDSRLYFVRGSDVLARTVDHTLVQQMVDEGRLAPADARGHPQRNRLLHCLGGVQTPRVDTVGEARLERNDVLLLCTDGLWEPLHDRQIVVGLGGADLAQGVSRLARLAEERAGAESDNVSALALAWHESAAAPAADEPPGPRRRAVPDTDVLGAPDPDILRGMFADSDSELARMRQALRAGAGLR
jgi:serine/threonine protein phosphatase PrpC